MPSIVSRQWAVDSTLVSMRILVISLVYEFTTAFHVGSVLSMHCQFLSIQTHLHQPEAHQAYRGEPAIESTVKREK